MVLMQKPSFGTKLQVLIKKTARNPVKAFFAFVVLNLTTYIALCFVGKDKVILPIAPAVKYVSETTIPKMLRKSIYTLYGKMFGVDFQEIRRPLDTHQRFIDFFCREVKPRTFDMDQDTYISPCDSKILNLGEVTGTHNQVVKGFKYSIGRFLTGQEVELDQNDLNKLKKNQDNKLYHVTLYLSPGDYHRFHSPSDFTIVSKEHYGNVLYPVDPRFLIRTKKPIYELNKRTCLVGKTPAGYMNLVLVGAQNVGGIVVHDKEQFSKGEQLGMFKLGSTIVMIFQAPPTLTWSKESGDRIKFGQSLYKV